MMMAFAWTVGIGDDRKGRKDELSCLLMHIYRFNFTYILRVLPETSATDAEDTGMG